MSTENKTLLQRILGSGKQKTQQNAEALDAVIKERLKSLVYDDDLVNELLPVFKKLHTTEGFETVYELLEAKEKQIEAVSGGDWFKQESNPNDKQQAEDEQQANDLVDDYLKNKYKD